MTSKQIMLNGPINHLGYGVHFVNWADAFIECCKEENIAVGIMPISNNIHDSELPENVRQSLRNGPITTHHSVSINLWHMHDMSKFSGDYRIGYTVFEMENLRPQEIFQMSQLDEIWVVSEWAKKVILKHLPTAKVEVVPEGVNSELFTPEAAEKPEFKDDEFFTFVNVGKLEKRKGHEQMIEAFALMSTDVNKPVRLLWNCINPFMQDFGMQIRKFLEQRGFFFDDANDNHEHYSRFRHEAAPDMCVVDLITTGGMDISSVVQIYQSADAGVYPYYAEGWNLPLIETMAMGIPVICTNHTGPTEYLNPHNHITLSDTREVIANDNMFFVGDQGYWKVPKVGELHEKMLDLVNNGLAEGTDYGHEARGTALNFSWKRSGQRAFEVLKSNENVKALFGD